MGKTTLTSRERLTRIFENKPIDRPSLKLWGANIGQHIIHPDYTPVVELACEITDIFNGAGSAFNILSGKSDSCKYSSERIATGSPLWEDILTTIETPKGTMRAVDRVSTVGEPGYTMEHFVKDESDLEKVLSMQYIPFEVDVEGYKREELRIGDRGITTFGLDHAGYALSRLTGSETFAYLSRDNRELVHEVISAFADRLYAYVKEILEKGIKPVFSWVGPELLSPPLVSDNDFTDFVYKYDKPLCDLIRNGGGYVWLHTHGKVRKLLDRYIDMGIDVLNPLEPPKNGDIDFNEAVEKYGNRIGWEGNIEIQDILQAPQETLRKLIADCVEAGKKSGRFILCPSAGFMEYVNPSKQYIDNLMFYLNYGLECIEK